MTKNSFPTCLLAALLLCSLAPCSATAQTEVTTVPEGYMMVTINAALATTAPKLTAFSLPLREVASASFVGQAAGRISSVTSNTIVNSAAGWAPGALSNATTPFFIRITSGAAEGRTLQISTGATAQNTATTLTVLNEGTDLTTLGIAEGDTYEIFPADTLLSFFGAGTADGTAGVLGGNATTGDLVRAIEGTSWSEYHYNLAAGQWRRGSVPVNMNNVVLRPDRGIIYVRRKMAAFSITLLGRVPDTDLRVTYNSLGGTFVAGCFPVDQTLSQLAFQQTPGWVAKTALNTIATSDKLQVFDGSAWNSYHYDAVLGQWRRGSVPINFNTTVIPAGTPVLVEKVSGSTGIGVLVRPLAYSLD